MPKVRDFNFYFGQAMDRSNRAADAVRKMNDERPFASREEIRNAFCAELRFLEAGAMTPADELALRGLGISV